MIHPPVFVLLTDFGIADPYVGQIRASLFSLAPEVPILDLTHYVPPFGVATGAFFLAASRKFYPPGAIFICVVDPGVGSARNLVCIQGQNHVLLGPDNGLLALAHLDMANEGRVAAYTLSAKEAMASEIFQGRDILVPAAAAVARGVSPLSLGTLMRELPAPPAWAQAEQSPGVAVCTVLHVDRFGNCILNLPIADYVPAPPLSVEIPANGHKMSLFSARHYVQLPMGVPGLIPGSQGYYELACNNASAAQMLGISSGHLCRITAERF